MVTKQGISILDPVVEPAAKAVQLSPRLTSLDGKVVGLYSNGKLNAQNFLNMVGQLLKEQYQVKEFVPEELGTVFLAKGSQVREDLRKVDMAVLAIGD